MTDKVNASMLNAMFIKNIKDKDEDSSLTQASVGFLRNMINSRGFLGGMPEFVCVFEPAKVIRNTLAAKRAGLERSHFTSQPYAVFAMTDSRQLIKNKILRATIEMAHD